MHSLVTLRCWLPVWRFCGLPHHGLLLLSSRQVTIGYDCRECPWRFQVSNRAFTFFILW